MSWSEASRVGLGACGVILALQAYTSQRTAPDPKPAEEAPRPSAVMQSDADLVRLFDADRAMGHVRHLSEEIGPRPAGSVAERQAADYIAAELAGWAWDVTLRTPVPIRGTALETCNVVATYPGHGTAPTVIVGAHIDSYCRDAVSPGANDNASGVAVALELARVLRHRSLPYCLKLVFFGGEESSREAPRTHHVGSDHFVAGLDGTERAQTAAMLSVDMVGAGKILQARRLGLGSDRARGWLLGAGEALGVKLRSDTGRAWSDHEAFERAGIPSVWLTRMDTAPAWHTPEDSYGKVGRNALLEAGRLCVRFLLQAESELGRECQDGRGDETP